MTEIAPHTRVNARRLRAGMTPQERKVWAGLRDLNHRLGTHFRRQAPVGRFIADFVDFGRRMVIEVDGGQHGGAGDAARDGWFKGEGYLILRFWNNEVDDNLDGVMQVVLDALEDCPPPPAPPHGGGRGGTRRHREVRNDDDSAWWRCPPPPAPPHRGEERWQTG